jgi:hypothetical protein
MSDENSLDWILDLPRDWERPAELRSPTKSTELNLAIVMLGSESIGNDCIELVGEFLVQVSGFNTWVGSTVKGIVYIFQQDSVQEVYDAWKSYVVALDSRGGKLHHEKYDHLLSVLRSSNANMAEARGGA